MNIKGNYAQLDNNLFGRYIQQTGEHIVVEAKACVHQNASVLRLQSSNVCALFHLLDKRVRLSCILLSLAARVQEENLSAQDIGRLSAHGLPC